jgi:hypothetical protein
MVRHVADFYISIKGDGLAVIRVCPARYKYLLLAALTGLYLLLLQELLVKEMERTVLVALVALTVSYCLLVYGLFRLYQNVQLLQLDGQGLLFKDGPLPPTKQLTIPLDKLSRIYCEEYKAPTLLGERQMVRMLFVCGRQPPQVLYSRISRLDAANLMRDISSLLKRLGK